VSSSDFRQIVVRGDRSRKERLFRAAVTAFSSLTRPSRNEIAQLEDLALPLYDSVSTEARRFVAAVLSEVENPPAALVRRLADEPPDIAAPVLLRSTALTDVDLIALIGRHGLDHARVIGKRANLNPTIAMLVRALLRKDIRPVTSDGASRNEDKQQDRPMQSTLADAADSARRGPDRKPPGAAADDVRAKLRAMMQPAWSPAPARPRIDPERGPQPGLYVKLRDTALTGVGAFFETALADALGIDFRQAQAIRGGSGLLEALKFLELPEEQAFVVAAALYPAQFGHAEAIRLFLDRYRLIHREAAADRVRGWKEATLATALSRRQPQPAALHTPANHPGQPATFGKALKAS
jgi:uncharacterized protein (DUF2336 family)